VEWYEIRNSSLFGESNRVEEEKGEDHNNGGKNRPPELAVHGEFDSLLAFVKIFHGAIEGVERPDVEGCQSPCQWENDQEYERAWKDQTKSAKSEDLLTSILRSDSQARNGINQAKYKMCSCENPDFNHRFAEGVLDNTVAHANDEKEEERK